MQTIFYCNIYNLSSYLQFLIEAKFQEFEPKLKFETRLKYCYNFIQ